MELLSNTLIEHTPRKAKYSYRTVSPNQVNFHEIAVAFFRVALLSGETGRRRIYRIQVCHCSAIPITEKLLSRCWHSIGWHTQAAVCKSVYTLRSTTITFLTSISASTHVCFTRMFSTWSKIKSIHDPLQMISQLDTMKFPSIIYNCCIIIYPTKQLFQSLTLSALKWIICDA